MTRKNVPLVDAISKVGAPLNSSLWKITVKKYATSASKAAKYGYPSEQAGVAQLWRTAYKLKVKDANKVDNDHKFVAVDQNNKYVVALQSSIEKGTNGLRYAQFYFKENNHYVEGA